MNRFCFQVIIEDDVAKVILMGLIEVLDNRMGLDLDTLVPVDLIQRMNMAR